MAEATPAVAIVGAGSVAQALGRLLKLGGEPIVALGNRTAERGARAAEFIGTTTSGPIEVVPIAEIPRLASRVVIAVSDGAIGSVAEALASGGMQSGIALHTCGALGPAALQPLRLRGVSCGLLHPLQTLMTPEQGVISLPRSTFALSGDEQALGWARHLVHRVTGAEGRWMQIEPDRLSYYHAGAVMASNALIAVLDAAIALLGRAGVTADAARRALAPLAHTSLENAVAHGTVTALTGPVARGDAATVAAHLRALAGADPSLAALYAAAAAHLLQLAKQRGLSPESARAIEQELERSGLGRSV